MSYLPTLKTLFTSLILAVFASASFAQSFQTEVEIIQEAFGLDKKVAVANFMQLEENADRFWEIYDQYEAERKQLGTNRIQIIADYAKSN